MSLDAKLERVKRRLQMCREVLHGSYEIDWQPRNSSWKTDVRSKKHYSRERDRQRKQESARHWGGRKEKSVKQWQSELEKYNKYLEPRHTSRNRSSDSEEARWKSPAKYAYLVEASSDSDWSDSSSSSSVTEGLSALLYKLKSESSREERTGERQRKEREHAKKHREREESRKERKSKARTLHVKNESASTGAREKSKMERDAAVVSPKNVSRIEEKREELGNDKEVKRVEISEAGAPTRGRSCSKSTDEERKEDADVTDVDDLLAKLAEETKGMSDESNSGDEGSGNIEDLLAKFAKDE